MLSIIVPLLLGAFALVRVVRLVSWRQFTEECAQPLFGGGFGSPGWRIRSARPPELLKDHEHAEGAFGTPGVETRSATS
jgi:hypothetical protein